MTNRTGEAFHVWESDTEGHTYVATVHETVADILRPLAEENGDPRLAALWQAHFTNSYGIDTSLGAIVRAAAACGLVVIFYPNNLVKMYEERILTDDVTHDDEPEQVWYGEGATPEEAAARALMAMVEEK